MSIWGSLQPDQQAHLWNLHVSLYESVFEPVTLGLALKAIEALGLKPGAHIIDSGAGSGGAALELARRSSNHRDRRVGRHGCPDNGTGGG